MKTKLETKDQMMKKITEVYVFVITGTFYLNVNLK